MGRVLLDTHAFIWIAQAPDQLGPDARRILALRSTIVYVSAVSLWEIAIKMTGGSLEFDDPLETVIQREFENNGYQRLDIENRHLMELLRKPTSEFAHGDPFDRLLSAQAVAEGLDLISIDAKLDAYGVRGIW